MEHNESTPSLVGANIRNVTDNDEYDKEHTSPTKASQRVTLGAQSPLDEHKDYTSVNELADEGALINDEQEYGDLLDSTGNVIESFTKPAAVITGIQDDKLSSKSKDDLIVSSLPQPVEIDEHSHKDFVVVDIPHHPSVDVADASTPQDGSGTPSIYELKNSDSGMSLEDLIDSQLASMNSLSSDLQKKISGKKKTPASLASQSRSTSRLRNVESAIPDSVIENDSLQQVPAGAREGMASPLIQSRSQSKIRSIEVDTFGREKPHLARGDSYSGVQTYESRSGRRTDRDGLLGNLSSREYLRSVSRSRSRMGKETTLSNQDLTAEGALVNDDLDHDPEMIHQLDQTLEEEEEDEDESAKADVIPKTSETTTERNVDSEDSLDIITQKLEDVLKEASPVTKSFGISPEEYVVTEQKTKEVEPEAVQEGPEEVATESPVDDADEEVVEHAASDEQPQAIEESVGDAEDEEVANVEPTSSNGILEPSVTEVDSHVEPSDADDDDEKIDDVIESDDVTEAEAAVAVDDSDVLVTATEPVVAIDEDEPVNETQENSEGAVDNFTDESYSDKVGDDVLSTESTDGSDDRELEVEETIDATAAGEYDGSSALEFDEVEHDAPIPEIVGEPEPGVEEETADAPVLESIESGEVQKEDSISEKAIAEVEAPALDVTETEETEQKETPNENEIAEASESTKDLGLTSPIADETERLIDELEAQIGDLSVSSIKDVVPDVSALGDESVEESKEIGLSTEDKKEDVEENEPIVTEESTTKEVETVLSEPAKAESEDEEIYEPTKEEIIEMLKDEPVYLYTSLAGGGFLMPQRTNRLATILTANRIAFTYRDLGTDEEARNVWRRYSKGRVPPGIVRGKDDIIGNWEEIEEANEDYRVRELIYETL